MNKDGSLSPIHSRQHQETGNARRNFLTAKQCAEQFRMYANTNPSKDSRFSLNFCADFLDEFCAQSEPLISTPSTKPTAAEIAAKADSPSGPTDKDSKEEEKKETNPDMRSLDAAIHSANEISDKTGLYGRNSGVFGTIVSIIERAVNRQFPPVPSEETGQQQ